jgi:flagellin-like protein
MFRSNLAPTTGILSQKGITGLETAIVLIAFVVVASVFAFTILSAGVFSSEANKQTIHAGLKETRTRLSQQGSAFAFAGKTGSTQAVFKIVFIVSNSLAGEPVDLTAPYTADGAATDPDVVVGASTATIISYADENQRMSDIAWSQTFIGTNNGDALLEDGEKAEITVWLMDRLTGTAVGSNSSIAYTDGDSGNGGSSSGLTASDSLVVKSTSRTGTNATTRCAADSSACHSAWPSERNEPELKTFRFVTKALM